MTMRIKERRTRQPRVIHWIATRRTLVKVAALALVAYVGVYFFLSAAGRWRATRDIVQWEPFGTRFYLRLTDEKKLIIRGSYLGYVYAPLTLLDRAFVHPHRPNNSEEAERARDAEQKAIERAREDERNARYEE